MLLALKVVCVLVCLRNVDGLSFWVIKSVHCLDVCQHAEPIVADHGKKECEYQAQPDPHGQEIATSPLGPEVAAILESERLNRL